MFIALQGAANLLMMLTPMARIEFSILLALRVWKVMARYIIVRSVHSYMRLRHSS